MFTNKSNLFVNCIQPKVIVMICTPRILVFTTAIVIIACNLNSKEYERNILPDYDYLWPKEQKMDLRTKLKERKRSNHDKNIKIKMFNHLLLNSTEYLDGILHEEIHRNNLQWNKIKKIENDFRNLLSMNGVKYIYKRDMYWRTLREVKHLNGTKETIRYRCHHLVENNTCVNCHNSGYWIIEEEPPPCPYEVFSIINGKQICVANFTQYLSLNSSCPSKVKYFDLAAKCDNPIETTWKITRTYYSDMSEMKSDICEGRETCEIMTTYAIMPNSIIFRIINSSNNVIYSRIMKNDNKNYACIRDCGIYNPKEKKIIKLDKPLIVNLLDIPHKNKRENVMSHEKTVEKKKAVTKKIKKKYIFIKKKSRKPGKYRELNYDSALSILHPVLKIATVVPESDTTMSHCKRLENNEEEEEDSVTEDIDYY